jgi:hypothetical protein
MSLSLLVVFDKTISFNKALENRESLSLYQVVPEKPRASSLARTDSHCRMGQCERKFETRYIHLQVPIVYIPPYTS